MNQRVGHPRRMVILGDEIENIAQMRHEGFNRRVKVPMNAHQRPAAILRTEHVELWLSTLRVPSHEARRLRRLGDGFRGNGRSLRATGRTGECEQEQP